MTRKAVGKIGEKLIDDGAPHQDEDDALLKTGSMHSDSGADYRSMDGHEAGASEKTSENSGGVFKYLKEWLHQTKASDGEKKQLPEVKQRLHSDGAKEQLHSVKERLLSDDDRDVAKGNKDEPGYKPPSP